MSALHQDPGFDEIKLGDAVTFQRGFDITKNEQSAGEVPIVSSSGVSSFHNQSKTKGPGVVIGRKGTLGSVHYLKGNFWPHDTTLWVKDFKGNNPRFISYFLKPLHLENFDTGSSNPTLNRNHIHKIGVVFPKPHIQKKIAAVLSAYDDLIENNKRRIALLEKMAEEIYREWFVRLRFPGHEKVKVVKGVPEGWEIEKIKNVVSRLPFGRIYRESELNDSGKVIVIDQSQAEFLGFYDGEPQHKATAEKPIILFGDHSCKMLMMTKPFSLAENVIPFVAKNDAPVYFLFHLVKGTIETTEYKRHWTELTNKEIYAPPIHLQQRFQETVKPHYQQIELMNDAIRLATKTRDMLLPRLISGKLSVENLDIQFPPGMEA